MRLPAKARCCGGNNYGMKLCLAWLVVVAACGTSPDERPVTFEVVTLSVLAPTCGQVQCHSTTTRTAGLAFDTLAAARDSMQSRGDRQEILDQIQDGSMPPDAPLADEDAALIEAWIAAGAPGL